VIFGFPVGYISNSKENYIIVKYFRLFSQLLSNSQLPYIELFKDERNSTFSLFGTSFSLKEAIKVEMKIWVSFYSYLTFLLQMYKDSLYPYILTLQYITDMVYIILSPIHL
jgi:hypothetical protein